jgi:hypothetical protein
MAEFARHVNRAFAPIDRIRPFFSAPEKRPRAAAAAAAGDAAEMRN